MDLKWDISDGELHTAATLFAKGEGSFREEVLTHLRKAMHEAKKQMRAAPEREKRVAQERVLVLTLLLGQIDAMPSATLRKNFRAKVKAYVEELNERPSDYWFADERRGDSASGLA